MEQIRSLNQITLDCLHTAREAAFNGYARTWSRDEYEKMLHRRGYAPELSFGAFDSEKLVSFTLNGVGSFNGLKTAYDTGTGTLAAYRGKGLATNIFRESLPALKQAGIEQCLLEVLQTNTKAISIYTTLGFKITRELDYFVQNTNKTTLNQRIYPFQYDLHETDLSKQNEMREMWDFIPSWQNSFDALLRKPADFKIIGAFNDNEFIGYGIIEPASGDIPQLAVRKAYRRQGAGSSILRKLLQYNTSASIRVINTETRSKAMRAFLVTNWIFKSGAQYEMIKNLTQ